MSSKRLSNNSKGCLYIPASNRSVRNTKWTIRWNRPKESNLKVRLRGRAEDPNPASEPDISEASAKSSSDQTPIITRVQRIDSVHSTTEATEGDIEGELQMESSQPSSPADVLNVEGGEDDEEEDGEESEEEGDGGAGHGGDGHATSRSFGTQPKWMPIAQQSRRQPQLTYAEKTSLQPRPRESASPSLPEDDPEPRSAGDDDFRLRKPQWMYLAEKKARQLRIAKERCDKEKRLRIWWWCGSSHGDIDDLMVVPASLVKM